MLDRAGLERYERQIDLFGRSGQRLLQKATALIAGAGGLGTAAAAYLVAAGLGRLRLVDRDIVMPSNLNRQVLYSVGDLGRRKASVLAGKLKKLNPRLEVNPETLDLGSLEIGRLVASVDIIVDALDNFPGRYVLNAASLDRGIPLVHGSIRGFYGQLMTIVPGMTPCLRCVFPESPKAGPPSVAGPVCGVIGSLQAMEVIKYLQGKDSPSVGRLLVFDGLKVTLEEVEVRHRPGCPDCGGRPLPRKARRS